ncbi:hypothetical protein N0V88_003710 [Collariella sp. IMI 366227]|nr:hypothetical protein N0V88_003710 [Collariella sp. IMI 366227]
MSPSAIKLDEEGKTTEVATKAVDPKVISIQRTTLFKVPDKENQKALVAAYEKLATSETKTPKPCFVHIMKDQRSGGYTVMATTAFASEEEMEYYDSLCLVHLELKRIAQPLCNGPPLVVNVQAQVLGLGGSKVPV